MLKESMSRDEESRKGSGRSLSVQSILPHGAPNGAPVEVTTNEWFPTSDQLSDYHRFLTMPFGIRAVIEVETGFPRNPGIAKVWSEDRLLAGREKIDTLALIYQELVMSHAWKLWKAHRIKVTK